MEKRLDELRTLLAWMREQVEQLATEVEPLRKVIRLAGLVETASIFQGKAQKLYDESY